MNNEDLQIPQNPSDFFPWLKETSEKFWEIVELKKGILGFQIQQGTKWNKGLSNEEIRKYEKELGFEFPEIYKIYLRNMNGTDKPAINIYANSGKVAFAPNFYSFPNDLETVKDYIQWIYEEFEINEEKLRSENIPHIIPIVGHRFLIADYCERNPILSIYGRDAILYSPNLQILLVTEIFHSGSIILNDDFDFDIKFWLQNDSDEN